ncbi:MAG TPA: hypothetical protein VIU37_04555 [Candidatus Limnocylindrales bacterium]|jgi:hypothetical protein
MGGFLIYAVVLAVVGGATWWLMSQDMAAGPWLLAAVLIGHGVVHTMFAISPAATSGGPEWPFDVARSWAVTGAGLDLNVVRAVGAVLIAVVVGGFALAALSTVGLVVPAGWWPAAVGGSAVVSIVVLVLFFNPQLVLGIGIDAVLLWAVATKAWVPA